METNILPEPMTDTKVNAEKPEDLPLTDRVKLADEHKPFDGIQTGWLIDAKDTVDNWCVSTVLKVEGNEVKVNYDGWSAKYDDVSALVKE
jgi:hypothetical protein